MLKVGNPFFDFETVPSLSDDAIKARLRHIDRDLEVQRHVIFMLETESQMLFKTLTRSEPKPTVVKAAVRSIVSVSCHICGKPTHNKVNGKFECKDHSAVSRMSELQRRVLNDMQLGIE